MVKEFRVSIGNVNLDLLMAKFFSWVSIRWPSVLEVTKKDLLGLSALGEGRC